MLELHVEEIKTKTEISLFSLTCPLQDGFDEKKKKKKEKRKSGKISRSSPKRNLAVILDLRAVQF